MSLQEGVDSEKSVLLGSQHSKDDNLKWFLFENKMRDIVQEIIDPLFTKDNYTSERMNDINEAFNSIKKRVEELEHKADDHHSQLKRADFLYTKVEEIERKFTKSIEEIKAQITFVNQTIIKETERIDKSDTDYKTFDDKIKRLVGNVNHSRDTFLDLKGQVYREISKIKESFFPRTTGNDNRNSKDEEWARNLHLTNRKS